jgi:tRNA(Ile)-lysidine synthetase-like protein
MKYLLAVSGGVDSVVLLDVMARGDHEVIVAHVDHGIREDSVNDARFVEALAVSYGRSFVTTRLELGPHASEERARDARYAFLYAQAKQYDAVIVTAQHLDDLVETVALNLERGTGWRGLTVMARAGIWRPFLEVPKRMLYDYALHHQLEWVEDSTNRSGVYQRNRLRARLAHRPVSRGQLHDRWLHQIKLRREIDGEIQTLLAHHHGSRYFLTQLDRSVAVECLGADIEAAGGLRPMRPQLERALLAIKTARPGTVHHVGGGVSLRFSARNYTVEVV